MNSRVVGLVGRGARALVLEVERAPVLGGGPNRSAMPQASLSATGLIIGFMGPVFLTPEKQCYTVLFLQIFREVVIHARGTFQRKQLRDRQLE
jgi:hypothetical protein